MARLACIVLLTGCAASAQPPADPDPAPVGVATPPTEVVFEGMCDASGAVALSARELLVADDEDNVLRVYDADRGGPPLTSVDVSEALGLERKGKKRIKFPEMDLEAATMLGDRAYWVTSHGRNSKGKEKPERLRLFSTTIPRDGDASTIEVVGDHDALLEDLIADARYAGFGLEAASELAPKAPGGLNIEGLSSTADGDLMIGFRSPLMGGDALIVTLLEPEPLLADGGTARFGDPILLDLGGHGIRSLSWWRGRYLIAAGDPGDGGATPQLYAWDGRGAPELLDVDLAGYNPEGFFSPEDRDAILLLSDDGTVEIDGAPCKELEDPAQRRFRGAWLRP